MKNLFRKLSEEEAFILMLLLLPAATILAWSLGIEI
jgi:hypothetical protein